MMWGPTSSMYPTAFEEKRGQPRPAIRSAELARAAGWGEATELLSTKGGGRMQRVRESTGECAAGGGGWQRAAAAGGGALAGGRRGVLVRWARGSGGRCASSLGLHFITQ